MKNSRLPSRIRDNKRCAELNHFTKFKDKMIELIMFSVTSKYGKITERIKNIVYVIVVDVCSKEKLPTRFLVLLEQFETKENIPSG